MSDCIFCKIAAGEIPADKLYEDDEVVAFWDLDPQAPKHFLVIPKSHLRDSSALSEEDAALIGRIIRIGAHLAKENGLDDYRFVVNNGASAGQTVFHFHLHVLGGRVMGWPPG
ncbi:MAG TPA: histidine triad nucleotide-binding protein [Desulfobacterales bacterium]|uniref:Bis(5'-nucleosyl)-tetraphosphatase (Asymmetrical) n=1 Tax=hydrothermal vent metagenome TaxID=652676 RepID=A0A3B0V6Y9_9ZZZZ|nr:histidine triad nucleotide-binding protein [Desulfobacterales bacterium]